MRMVPKAHYTYARRERYGKARHWFEWGLWSLLWGFGVVILLILLARVYGP